jgi:CRP-like cAMP-binding protein
MTLPLDRVRQSGTNNGHGYNACFAALSPSAQSLLRPHLTEIALSEGTVLWGSQGSTTDIYFPVSGLISVVLAMPNGELVEVASIAREAGVGPYFDPDQNDYLTTGVVQVGGNFIRISASNLLCAANQNRQIKDLIGFCEEWILLQGQQIAACNAVHAADRRFCRWLHECAQRIGTTTVRVTQESIAAILGVRRTTVTLIAQGLQTNGLIQYRRGRIVVSDMSLLRSSSCECCDMLDRQRWPSTRLLAGRESIEGGAG